MAVKPLSTFLQPRGGEFNKLNKTPLATWLDVKEKLDASYRARMKTLGNLVVPQAGELAFEILFQMRRQCV